MKRLILIGAALLLGQTMVIAGSMTALGLYLQNRQFEFAMKQQRALITELDHVEAEVRDGVRQVLLKMPTNRAGGSTFFNEGP